MGLGIFAIDSGLTNPPQIQCKLTISEDEINGWLNILSGIHPVEKKLAGRFL